LVLDEEKMRPGDWLGLVLYAPFSDLILIVGWQEGHPAHKKSRSTDPLILFENRWRRKT